MKWHTQRHCRLCIVALTVCLGLFGLLLPRPAAADITPVPNGALDNPDTLSVSPDRHWLTYRVTRQANPDTFDLLLLDLTDPTLTPRTINKDALNVYDNAQFSPNNRYLLHEQGTRLFLYDLTTFTDRQLTDGIVGNSYEFMPNEQYVIAISDPDMWSVPLDGSTPVALIPPGLPAGRFPNVELSPDSRYLMVTYKSFSHEEEGFVVLAPVTATGEIVLQGFGLTPHYPQFSATANRAYFMSGQYDEKDQNFLTKMYSVDVQTGEISIALDEGVWFGRLVSSPDHHYLLIPWYFRNDSLHYIMRITTETGDVQGLFATERNLDADIEIAPDNNLVVLAEIYNGPVTIWSMTYEPIGNLHTIYNGHSTSADFEISPDSTTVALKDSVGYLIYDLYTVPIDGSAPAIKRLDTPIRQFAFAPDSNAIWATPRRGTLYDIAYLPPNGDPLTIYRGESNPLDDAIALKTTLPNARLLFDHVKHLEDVSTYRFAIADTIPAGTLTSGRDWLAEGASTPLTVTILPSSTVPVSFTLALTGSIDPADVQIEPLTLSIPPGETHAAFTLTHLVDNEEESPLTDTVELVPAEGAAVGDTITVTLSFIDEAHYTFLPLIRLFD